MYRSCIGHAMIMQWSCIVHARYGLAHDILKILILSSMVVEN